MVGDTFAGVAMSPLAANLKSRSAFAPLLLLAVLASGCSGRDAKLESDPVTTSSTSPAGVAEGPAPSYLRTRDLATAWAAHPGDEKIGMEYAANLGKLGQVDTQTQVLKSISLAHPQDAALQSRIGKEFLAAQRPGEAATILERATASGNADWKAYSALGTAYDQQGQFDLARQQYNKALALQPGSLSVENNLGMSYALQGKLPEAEKMLRSTLNQPGSAAMPQIRQNLSLVVGLQGRLDEAKQIASADLPPDQVDANMQYLQQMLSKPNTWAQLQNQNTAN
jgi:Flp pilus assembly protein TadD